MVCDSLMDAAPAEWIPAAGPRPINTDPDGVAIPDAVLKDLELSLIAEGLYALVLSGQGQPINPYEDAIEDVEDIRAAIDELVAAGLVLRVVNP